MTLEAVKRAENSDDLLVRLVERHGAQSDISVDFPTPLQHALECNLLEREPTPATINGPRLVFQVKPYEIRSFLVG